MLHLTAAGVGLRGLLSAVSLLNVVLLARALGPGGRGEYFLFIAAVALLARLADVGMSPSAVVFASSSGGVVSALHRKLGVVLLAAWAIVGAIGFLAVNIVGVTVGDLSHERLLLALAILPLAVYEQVWLHLMVGLRRVVSMNVVQLGAGLLMLALNVALVVLVPGGVAVAVAIYCAVLLVKTPVMIGLVLRGQSGEHADVKLRDVLWFGARSYPNGLANLLWTRVPAFVLDIFHGAGAVGVFSIAQQVLEQLVLPVQAAQDAMYQGVARLPRARATEAMNRYLRLGLWSMVALVIVVAIVAPYVVSLIFGASFGGSGVVLQVLLLSALATSASALLSPYFFGQLQRPGLASTVGWVRLLLAVGLSVALAPALAEVGVAVAIAGADIAATLLMLSLYVHIAGTPLRLALLPGRDDFAAFRRPLHFRAREP